MWLTVFLLALKLVDVAQTGLLAPSQRTEHPGFDVPTQEYPITVSAVAPAGAPLR